MGNKEPTDLNLLAATDLIRLIAEGDERAFEQLFKRYATSLAAVANKMLQDEEAKQEVIQEVFLKIWLNRDRLEDVQHLSAWMRKLTINESIMYLRKVTLYRKTLGGVRDEQKEETDFTDPLHIKEMKQAVERALHVMPPQRRKIYELSRNKGLSTREISKKMGRSEGYIRNAISAALTQIRGYLSPYIEILPTFFFFFFQLA